MSNGSFRAFCEKALRFYERKNTQQQKGYKLKQKAEYFRILHIKHRFLPNNKQNIDVIGLGYCFSLIVTLPITDAPDSSFPIPPTGFMTLNPHGVGAKFGNCGLKCNVVASNQIRLIWNTGIANSRSRQTVENVMN